MNSSHSVTARTALYYLVIFAQALGSIFLPAASYILKSTAHVGLSDTQYGLLYLPMIVSMIATTAFFYRLLERFGKWRLFLSGLGINLVFLALVLSVSLFRLTGERAFVWLLAGNGFLGCGFGLLVSDLNLLVEDLYPSKRDAALSGLHGSLGIGASVAPLGVEFFHRTIHWGTLAAVDLCLLAVIALMVARDRGWVPEAGNNSAAVLHRREKVDWKKLPPAVTGFFVALIFYGIVESLMGNWSPVYLTAEKGFSPSTGATCLALFWFSLTLGRLLASFLTIRCDARIFYRLLPFFILAGLLLLIRTEAERAIGLPYILTGFGCSAFYPLTVSLAVGYHERWRAVISSMSLGTLIFGTGIGSCVTGYLRERGIADLDRIFAMGAVCAVIMGVFAFFLTVRKIPRGV